MSKLLAGIGLTWIFILITSLLCIQIADVSNSGTVYATPVGEVNIAPQTAVFSEPAPQAPVNNEPQDTAPKPTPVQTQTVSSSSSGSSSGGSSRSRYAGNPNRNDNSKTTPEVEDKLDNDGQARVIVSLSGSDDQSAVLDYLAGQGADIHTQGSNMIAVTADADTINSLEQNSGVNLIEEDLPLQTLTYEGFDLIDLEQALVDGRMTINTTSPSVTSRTLAGAGTLNLTGANQAVCIIDSGIYTAHPEFEGKIVAEWDFYGDDANAGDNWDHGSKMAGIIAAQGIKMQGIAYNANIIDLRITDDSGNGWSSDLLEALDWCLDNASAYNITSVYIGVGTGTADGTESACTTGVVAQKIDELVSNNITVITPAGNDGNWTRIAYPACVNSSISVGAVADGTPLSGRTEDSWLLSGTGTQSNRRDGLLDLLAPGDIFTRTTNAITAENYTSGVGTNGVGTSVAAAYTAGASMLLREYWDANGWNFRPAGLVNDSIPYTIDYIFKQTGKQIEDVNNSGVYYPRLDFNAAVNYEENTPVVALETANDSTVAPGAVTLEYNVADQHDMHNCTLYIDSVANQTDTSITNSVTQSFSVTLAEGSYDWKVECVDKATVPNTGSSETRIINVVAVDTEAPQYSSLTASPNTYVKDQTYTLSATWTDNTAVDSVVLKFDGTNYTDASKAGDVYSKTFTDLPAGTYSYTWYANDTEGNQNNTGAQVFTINKAASSVTVGSSPAWTVISGTETTVTCTTSDPVPLKLYRDGTEVSIPDVQTLAINTYDYVCNTTGNENYTASEDSNTLTVSSKNPSTATLTFDKVSPQTYGTTVRASCIDTNPEAEAKLYRNGVDVTSSENGSDITLPAGTHDYVCNVTETATYTFAEDTDSFAINKAASTVTLSSSPSWSEVSGTETTVSCTTSDPVAVKLYRDGTEVSTPDVQTLAVNTYDYVCNTTGSVNYTVDEETNTLTITAAPDITPPVISGVNNDSITHEEAHIEWDTDENANATLNYGIDTNLGTVETNTNYVAYRDFTITGLIADQIYYYNVTSCDAAENCATEGPYQFRTLPTPNNQPNLTGIPDQTADEDVAPSWQIDLYSYTTDDQPLANGDFDVLANTNPTLIDCHISSNRYVVCDNMSTPDAYGSADITIRYEDEFSLADTDVFTITVNQINDVPVLDPISNITVNEGELVQITPSANDPDPDTLAYSYESPVNTSGSWLTSFTDEGSYDINVTVDDGNGGQDSQMVNIQVNHVDAPDIRIKSFLQQTRNPVANSNTFFSVIIENIGETAASNIEWMLDFGNTHMSLGTITSLAAGETSNIITRKDNYTSAGDYTAVLTVDYTGAIGELNESNNNKSRTVSIS